ncbi:MAG: type I addiction module toxin, SymE family [Pedobacter sp.]|nr:MAG: type I addiction module toxin, SymE family [Pedobacter sp.]
MNQQNAKKEALSNQGTREKREMATSNVAVVSAAKTHVKGKLRRLKVYYKLGFSKKTPVILLQGEWIRDLGFNVKDTIIVSGENGRLEVTRAD